VEIADDDGAEGELLFFDDFDSTEIDAANWSLSSGAGIDGTGIDEPSAPNSLRLNGLDWVTARPLDLSGYSQVTLSYHYQRGGGGDSPDAGDDLILEYWSGSDWTELQRQEGSGADMTGYVESQVVLPAAALRSDFGFRLRTTGTVVWDRDYDDWFVDDVKVATGPAPAAAGPAEAQGIDALMTSGTFLTDWEPALRAPEHSSDYDRLKITARDELFASIRRWWW